MLCINLYYWARQLCQSVLVPRMQYQRDHFPNHVSTASLRKNKTTTSNKQKTYQQLVC